MVNSISLIVLAAVIVSAQTRPPVEAGLFRKAAEEWKLDVRDLRMDPDDLNFYGSGRYRLKLFDALIDEPLKTPSFARILSRTILDNADSLWMLAFAPWARIDEGVRRGLIARPEKALLDSTDGMLDLPAVLIQGYGMDSLSVKTMSGPLITGLWMIMHEIKNSVGWVKTALGGMNEQDLDSVIRGLEAVDEDGLSNRRLEDIIDAVDFKALAAGALDLSYVLTAAAEFLKDSGTEKSLVMATELGKIAIGGTGRDVYADGPYTLIIDFGGNDEYRSCAVTGLRDPVSIVIDLEGDDEYSGRFGPGAGICGYGIVLDHSGNDRYRADELGPGTGVFGEGIVLDRGGDDIYETGIYGIGAGLYGAGVVADLGGNDQYTAFQCSEGYGFVKGCGILIDRSGDDRYVARDDTIKYPASQTADHNASLSQGVGFGIRADFTDGHSMAGGVGMLIDGSGDDRYSCGVFGQGCGYWFGIGMLADFSGNDEYDGVWYVQGAGAHFAVGVLLDSAGDDRYAAALNMAQGAGHDFTLGYFMDYAGNDSYVSPNLSLGSGNANGMGVFLDAAGDDRYETHSGITLGGASTASRGGLRDIMETIGVFIDGGGRDLYEEPYAGNRRKWMQEPPLDPPLEAERCLGIDL